MTTHDDMKQRLENVAEALRLTDSKSEIPKWVRDSIAQSLSEIAKSEFERAEVASKLRGAYRLIGDNCNPPDEDSVLVRLRELEDWLST